MPRFIKILQILIVIIVGGFITYDLILNGVRIFSDKYLTLSCVLLGLLELALFVIYKLVEDD